MKATIYIYMMSLCTCLQVSEKRRSAYILKGPIQNTYFQLQRRSPAPTATRLARFWAPPTPIQLRFADRGWSRRRSEFSDVLWAERRGWGWSGVWAETTKSSQVIDHFFSKL